MLNLELPWPNPLLSPNRAVRMHWAQLHKLRAAAHQDAYVLTKDALAKTGYKAPDGPLALRITFVLPDGRPRDVDNLLAASKKALDGVAQALGINDKLFRPITLDVQRGAKPGATLVTIGAPA